MFRAPQLPRNLEAALRDIVDPKPAVRMDAAGDLVAHGETSRERVLPALEKAASDADSRVRAAALRGLGELRAKEMLPAILVACEDDDALVRQEAIAALGDVGDERAIGKLERALVDKRPEVRFQAVMSYPRVAASESDIAKVLERASRDEDEHVVHVALRMTEEAFGDDEGPRAIDDVVVPPPLVARARELLGHASPRVRAVAAVVVTRSGGSEGVDVLIGVVDGTVATPEAEDIAAAIELAGDRRLEGAKPALEKRAFGGLLGFGRDAWSWHARTALAKLGHERATREILRELDGWDRARRTLAVVAAGEARLEAARSRLVAMRDRPRGVDVKLVERMIARIDGRPFVEEAAADSANDEGAS